MTTPDTDNAITRVLGLPNRTRFRVRGKTYEAYPGGGVVNHYADYSEITCWRIDPSEHSPTGTTGRKVLLRVRPDTKLEVL